MSSHPVLSNLLLEDSVSDSNPNRPIRDANTAELTRNDRLEFINNARGTKLSTLLSDEPDNNIEFVPIEQEARGFGFDTGFDITREPDLPFTDTITDSEQQLADLLGGDRSNDSIALDPLDPNGLNRPTIIEDPVDKFVTEMITNIPENVGGGPKDPDEAQQGALSDQQDFLDQQLELFNRLDEGINTRFDNQLLESQRQFDVEQTGIDDRFNQQQTGIDDRFNTVQEQLNPFLAAGQRSIGSLESLINNPSQITQTPGFGFRFNQGQEAVQNAAAARGSSLGGNVLTALQAQGQGFASDELQNEFTRRATLFAGGQNSINSLIASIGQTGTESVANFDLTGRLGANNANNLSTSTNTAFQNTGTNLVNSGLGAAGGIQNTATNFANLTANQQRLNQELAINQQNLQQAQQLGASANRNNNIIGALTLAAGIATSNPLLAAGGGASLLGMLLNQKNKPKDPFATQPFTGTPQQSPLIRQKSQPGFSAGFTPR